MPNHKALLAEVIDYFWDKDGPGGWWAHDDDCTSYALQYDGKDGHVFYLDLDKNGKITLLWKRPNEEVAEVATFVANGQSKPE